MHKINTLFNLFLESPRIIKRLISVSYDVISILVCIFLALHISHIPFSILDYSFILIASLTLIGSIITFIKVGYYRAILRYMGLQSVFFITFGISISTLIFAISSYFIKLDITAVTLFLYWSFSLVLIGAARLFTIAIIRSKLNKSRDKVIIYGAGQSGRQLAKALNQGHQNKVVAYIDDDPAIFLSEIDGVKVYSPISIDRLIDKYHVSQILLALPSATHARRAEILHFLERFPIKVKTIASLQEIVAGKVQIEQLKELEIEDLLGRDSVEPDQKLLKLCISNKVVMVTGAGGSIGSELCRQIVQLNPSTIVLYELSEFALYSIEKKLIKLCYQNKIEVKIIALLGSVQHKNRLINVMRKYKVQTVYHAAAYKHVPIVEHNIVEGIRNNVFGTWYAAEAAAEAGVERFVLVSTDKAVRPTNIMGASKRLAELVLQGMNLRGGNTIFTMVRFGNVLGSSGSVVPLFREQIRTGGPVTVTHKDMIRYFMTIPEAAQLVIQAGSLGQGGDVFVLDMGEQVKISDLAERMVHLMGLTIKSTANPKGDIDIKYSGLRPGEKLYEELLIGDNVFGTTHAKIMSANENKLSWPEMQKALIILNELCDQMDCEGIVQLLLRLPTGYNPQHAVCDLLWESDKNKNNIVKFNTLQ